MRKELIKSMIDAGLDGQGISREQALELGTLNHEELDALFADVSRAITHPPTTC